MSPTRLMRFLTVLAVLFAPLGMLGGHAAMALQATPQATMDHAGRMEPAGHCADREKQSQDRPMSSIDCMIACAALPTPESETPDHPLPAAIDRPVSLATGLHGLHPESDPPPPRIS